MHEPRVLAIDLRSQLLGFAVLEGPTTLLDWGRKRFQNNGSSDNAIIVRKKIAALLAFSAPSVLVLKHTSGRKDKELLKKKSHQEAIKREAKRQSVEMIFLTRKDIHQAFRQSGSTSKYKIAGLISRIFPELAWKLPPKRKNYHPEHHSMPVFDAISLGLTYFARFNEVLEAKGEPQESAKWL